MYIRYTLPWRHITGVLDKWEWGRFRYDDYERIKLELHPLWSKARPAASR